MAAETPARRAGNCFSVAISAFRSATAGPRRAPWRDHGPPGGTSRAAAPLAGLLALVRRQVRIRRAKTRGGRWAADWAGVLEMAPGDDIVATQCVSAAQLGQPYDMSLINGNVPLWRK